LGPCQQPGIARGDRLPVAPWRAQGGAAAQEEEAEPPALQLLLMNSVPRKKAQQLLARFGGDADAALSWLAARADVSSRAMKEVRSACTDPCACCAAVAWSS
jgi:hypothetical protein